ncbi:MAG: hypothetical protein ACQEP2_00425 [Actinomycetota bacterium]
MKKAIILKIILAILSLLLLFISGCDQTLIDIYTQLNTDYSGTRTVELAIKTEYLQRGEVVLVDSQTLHQRLISLLPEGEIETFEEENYTHFKSTVKFNDVNFLKHVSIDNFSENPPERFYAKMEKDEYFFNSDYFFTDYIDMKLDDKLIQTSEMNSDYRRFDDLMSADPNLLSITYQIKFPVNIVDSNADKIGDNNIAIWNIKYGQQKIINIEGKKTKFLSYFLVVILGIIGLFVLFIVFALIFSSRRSRRIKSKRKSIHTYDNYFKQDKINDDY